MTASQPVGLIDTTVKYLELFAPPANAAIQPPDPLLEIVRAAEPTIRFYRFLYDNVGGDWLWSSRRALSDEALLRLIRRETVDLRVLWRGGVPAGYAEIDFRAPDDVELLYFGLMPEAIGIGAGKYFLDWTVRHAFSSGAQRLWVHTCDLDHPRAFSVYQSIGFEHFDTENTQELVMRGMAIPTHVADRKIHPIDNA